MKQSWREENIMSCAPKVRKNYYTSSSVSLSFPQCGPPGVAGTRGNRKGAEVKGGLSSTENTLGSEDRNPPLPASWLPAPVGSLTTPAPESQESVSSLGAPIWPYLTSLLGVDTTETCSRYPSPFLLPCPSTTPLAKPGTLGFCVRTSCQCP